jgi:UDPglucose 6-dehydrogenase
LGFTADVESALKSSDVIFICVNTPSKTSIGGCLGLETDMTAYYSVVNMIGKCCAKMEKVIVEKSTVPIGTARTTMKILSNFGVNCNVVSMPEFLAEGSAINDLIRP